MNGEAIQLELPFEEPAGDNVVYLVAPDMAPNEDDLQALMDSLDLVASSPTCGVGVVVVLKNRQCFAHTSAGPETDILALLGGVELLRAHALRLFAPVNEKGDSG